MEVLESITSYTKDMQVAGQLYQGQKEALDILYRYCNDTEPGMNISEIDSSFFDEFLIYWLPKNNSRLNVNEICGILEGIEGYCSHIQGEYNVPGLDKYELIKQYKKEYLRIYELKHLFSRYIGDPIIGINPLVIDFNAYKQYKSHKQNNQNPGIYQQGLFEVMEIDYDRTVVLRKIPKGKPVRIVLADYLIDYLRKGDILHLRIKQRQFFALWEVEWIKNCYLPKASRYLSN